MDLRLFTHHTKIFFQLLEHGFQTGHPNVQRWVLSKRLQFCFYGIYFMVYGIDGQLMMRFHGHDISPQKGIGVFESIVYKPRLRSTEGHSEMLTFEYPIHRRMSTKIFIIGYEFDEPQPLCFHMLRPDLVPYTITNFRHIRINKIVLINVNNNRHCTIRG